jgi:hypothetical protein
MFSSLITTPSALKLTFSHESEDMCVAGIACSQRFHFNAAAATQRDVVRSSSSAPHPPSRRRERFMNSISVLIQIFVNCIFLSSLFPAFSFPAHHCPSHYKNLSQNPVPFHFPKARRSGSTCPGVSTSYRRSCQNSIRSQTHTR